MTPVRAGLNAAVIAVGASETGKSYTMGTSGLPTSAQPVWSKPVRLDTSTSNLSSTVAHVNS